MQKKIAKLEKEKESLKKSNANLTVKIHRMKKKTEVTPLNPQKSVARLLRNNGLSPFTASKDIRQSLLFSEVLSEGIKGSVHQNRTKKRGSIRRVISGKSLRKYKLIKYASKKTKNHRKKMGKRKSKIIDFEQKKSGFDPEIYEHVKIFHYRDDFSTALPGKRDCKSIRKGTRLQKRVLNDYLSNLHRKM